MPDIPDQIIENQTIDNPLQQQGGQPQPQVDPTQGFIPPPDPDEQLRNLTNLIYGEAGGADYKTMTMVGASALNRLDSKRAKEFGSTLGEVMQKGYYAVSKNSKMYQQAISGEFPDEISEKAYKRSMAIASGLIKGTIEKPKGHFYFTDKEIKKLKKKGKKAFDFKKVKEVGKTGKYKVYSY